MLFWRFFILKLGKKNIIFFIGSWTQATDDIRKTLATCLELKVLVKDIAVSVNPTSPCQHQNRRP
jgi:hypothetical protein